MLQAHEMFVRSHGSTVSQCRYEYFLSEAVVRLQTHVCMSGTKSRCFRKPWFVSQHLQAWPCSEDCQAAAAVQAPNNIDSLLMFTTDLDVRGTHGAFMYLRAQF